MFAEKRWGTFGWRFDHWVGNLVLVFGIRCKATAYETKKGNPR
jgi:hypothetical protein